MLSKPINPSPYFTPIDVENGLDLSCQLNEDITGQLFRVFKNNDSNCLSYEDGTFNGTSYIASASISNGTSSNPVFENGNDYVWSLSYWNDTNIGTADATITPYQGSEKGEYIVCVQSTPILTAPRISAEQTYDSYGCVFPTVKLTDELQDIIDGIEQGISYVISFLDEKGRITYSGVLDELVKATRQGQSSTEYIVASYGYHVYSTTVVINSVETILFYNATSSVGILSESNYLKIGTLYYKINEVSVTSQSGVSVSNIVLTQPLHESITTSTSIQAYKDFENYNESPYYYFKARSAPTCTITMPSTQRETLTFTGTYTQPENVGIAYYKFDLYAYDPVSMTYKQIDTSGEIFSNSISYTYNGFVYGLQYRVALTGETKDGYPFEAVPLTFQSDYSITGSNDLSVSIDQQSCCAVIDFREQADAELANSDTIYAAVYSYSNIALHYDYVGSFLYTQGKCICDYNIKSNTMYYYTVFLYDSNTYTPEHFLSCLNSGAVTPKFECVCVCGTTIDTSNKYKIDTSNIWTFDLNVESDGMHRQYNTSYDIGFRKYPKASRGNANYTTSTTDMLIGTISKTSCEYEEDADIIDRWYAFCADGNPKFYRDRKGQKMLIDISDTTVGYMKYEACTVSFSYTQIGDTDKTSVYEERIL